MLHLPDLRLGSLVAEGGEGRVFELQGDEPRLFKQFRRPLPAPMVLPLVDYLPRLEAAHPAWGARARSATAWPVDVVVADDGEVALGTVIPRAPEQFWLQHKDGSRRLATLSYLTGDPERIEVAYGVPLPAPGSAERVAIAYALARLLEAWQPSLGAGATVPSVVHGDLSAKNVLWSLSPAPAVYVLDCDGARLVGTAPPGDESGLPADGDGGLPRPVARAVTPNWDDPAQRPDVPVGLSADRYALALMFLRVVGAAHFPLQGRQRGGERVNVDLELPRSWRRLPDMPELWELCERSLSLVNAPDRPVPAEWAAELEYLLGMLGNAPLAASVRVTQGDPVAALTGGARPRFAPTTVPDVSVRPVLGHRPPPTWQLISPRNPVLVPAGENVVGGPVSPHRGVRQLALRGLAMWGSAHRLGARMVRSPGRRSYGLRRLGGLALFDLAVACVGLFLVGMAVSPLIGL